MDNNRGDQIELTTVREQAAHQARPGYIKELYALMNFRDGRVPTMQARVAGQVPVVKSSEVSGTVQAQRFATEGPVTFRNASIRAVDFSRLTIPNWGSFNSKFAMCDFTGTTITTGCLAYVGQSTYVECVFKRTRMRVVSPGHARFEKCSFEACDIPGWQFFLNELVECTFVGRFRGLIFAGSPWGPGDVETGRQANEFWGNDFSRAELVDCSFRRGIDLDRQALPAGDRYLRVDNARERIRRAEESVLEWDQNELKRLVLVGLDVYGRIAADQKDLFLTRDELTPVLGQAASTALLGLLELGE